MTKQNLIGLLRDFILQRPGFEFANYGSYRSYQLDYRRVNHDMHDALTMLNYVEQSNSVSIDDMLSGFSAFSGRLKINDNQLEYCTGQYFPVEYRAAACAVLASVLWNYFREPGTTANDIRKAASRVFGRRISRKWFN